MIYILISILFNVFGQFFIKTGVDKISPIHITQNKFIIDIIHIIFYPSIFAGLFLYAVGSVFWIFALSKTNLSYAYPMLSLGYILVLILSGVILKENISLTKIAGVFVIVLGIILVSKST